MFPLLLRTNAQWKPYQCQLVYKRFLEHKLRSGIDRKNLDRNAGIWNLVQQGSMQLTGPGTMFFFRKLTPTMFSIMTHLSQNDIEECNSDEEEERDTQPT